MNFIKHDMLYVYQLYLYAYYDQITLLRYFILK